MKLCCLYLVIKKVPHYVHKVIQTQNQDQNEPNFACMHALTQALIFYNQLYFLMDQNLETI